MDTLSDLHDVLLSEAIAEAYSIAPVNDVILQTLEIRHPTFAIPVRLVADFGTLITPGDPDIFGWMLTLESNAPVDASASVLFQSCMFDITKPSQQAGQLPSITITVDNVAFAVSQYMDEAVSSRVPMQVTYREFLASNPSAPEMILGGLLVNDVTSTITRTSITAAYTNLTGFNFPAILYRAETHPGLIT